MKREEICIVLVSMMIGIVISVMVKTQIAPEIFTRTETSAVAEAAQSETPATSPYPMAPPKVVALSEWTEHDPPNGGVYRYISVDGKVAVQFVTAGGQWRGISFVPRDATVTEAEDNSIPSPAPTPK